MRLLKILLLIVGTSILSFCVENQKTGKEAKVSEESLSKAIARFNTAFQKGDIVVLEEMVSENYIHTNGNAKAIGKKQWFDYLRKRANAITSGKLEVLGYQMEETEIEFHDNVALVTGKITVTNKENGEIKNYEYRITNVWVYEAGNWKRAGFHDGKIK